MRGGGVMNDKPRVGEPSTDHRPVCAFSAKPGAPQCVERATFHIRVISIEWGEVALATCDAHAPIARSTGIVHDEHEFTGCCGMEPVVWMGDHCALFVTEAEPH